MNHKRKKEEENSKQKKENTKRIKELGQNKQ